MMGKTILLLCLLFSSATLFAGEKKLPPPTIPASGITVVRDGLALHFTWTNGNGGNRIVIARQGSAVTSVPVNGVDYAANQNFGSGAQLNPGDFVVHNGAANTVSIIGLTPGATYHIAIFEYNGLALTADYLVTGAPTSSATTFSSAPTMQASNVSISNIGLTTMTISWTAGNGSGAFVVMRANEAVNGAPTDLSIYLSNPRFGSGWQVGTGNYAVHQSGPTIPNTVTVTNLLAGATYHVAVFECNGLFGAFYNTTNPARASATTISRPTTPASNLNFNNVEGNSMRPIWTNGNGNRRLVIASTNPVTAVPADGVEYAANSNFTLGQEIAPGQRVVYVGTVNVANVTNLQPSTEYHYRIYEMLGTGAGTQYLTSSFASGSQSTLSPPTTQASNIAFSEVTGTSCVLNWTRGNGDECILVMKAGSPVDVDPQNLQIYNGNETFGLGQHVGAGNFVIARFSGNSVRVFGLSPGVTYHAAIYELNGAIGPVYNITNPARGSVSIGAHPTVAPRFGLGSFTSVEGNSMRIGWVAGDGTRRILIARAGSPVTAAPQDGIDYNSNTDFTLAQEISAGEKVLWDSTGTGPETITGLEPGVTYHFRLYEYNVVNDIPLYYTADFAQAITPTAAVPTIGSRNLLFSNATTTSINVSWQPGNGSNRMLVARLANPVDAEPVEFQSYTPNALFGSGDEIGTGNYVVYRGNGTNTQVTNLQRGTTYYFILYDLNGATAPLYLRPGLTGTHTLDGPPQNPAQQVIVTTTTSTSLTLRWINGTGNGRMVLMSEGGPVSQVPVNDVEYAADSVFGSGSELRTTAGNYVVFSGTRNSVTVTNLQSATAYYFTVYEYNRFGVNNILYLTSAAASGNATTTAALPVTLTDFNAAEINNKIKLNWATAQEYNSAVFEIQKSIDGGAFVTIASVNAAGHSDVPNHYQYTDDDPYDGTSYYRLKQVDRDGQFAYSRTLTIQYKASGIIRKIINPFNTSLFIQLAAGVVSEGSIWKLYDMQGRVMKTGRISGNVINVPMPALRPGMYLWEIIVHGKKQVIKLVKRE